VKRVFSGGDRTIPKRRRIMRMRTIGLGMILAVGMIVMAVTVFAQTNLTVVRHPDNTIWKMTCDGTSNCSPWTEIPGKFSTILTSLTQEMQIKRYRALTTKRVETHL